MMTEAQIRDAIKMLEARLQDTYKRIEYGYPNDKDKLAFTMAKIQALKWTLEEIPYLSL